MKTIKKNINCLIYFMLFIVLITNTVACESIDESWEIDYKSTRVIAQIDKNGITHINFIGTISNYGGINASEVKIDVKILNDGVSPSEPEGDTTDLESYGTKAVYTIENFKSGSTKDWIVRAEITDPENVKKIDYQIKVYIKNTSGHFDNIYSQKKSVDVVLADTDGDGLNDAAEVKFGTDINLRDTDNDGETDYKELQAGTDPLNTKSNSQKGIKELIGMLTINSIVILLVGVTSGLIIRYDDSNISFVLIGFLAVLFLVVGGIISWEVRWVGKSPFILSVGIGLPALIGLISSVITHLIIEKCIR